MAQGYKSRLNVTIDPDIHRDAKRVFKALDMNMSGYIEQQLALFLQVMAPLRPLMEQVELGKVDPAELKTAMRAFSASGNTLVGNSLSKFGEMQAEMQQLLEVVEAGHTDKK